MRRSRVTQVLRASKPCAIAARKSKYNLFPQQGVGQGVPQRFLGAVRETPFLREHV
ncbi:MAG: hypothetical protein OXU61_04860 [Gammaproteobacteria bacterium]|nr:hypothetical protein [Gammaproteobacteria bacterium]